MDDDDQRLSDAILSGVAEAIGTSLSSYQCQLRRDPTGRYITISNGKSDMVILFDGNHMRLVGLLPPQSVSLDLSDPQSIDLLIAKIAYAFQMK